MVPIAASSVPSRERNSVKEQSDPARVNIIPRLLQLSATLWGTPVKGPWETWMDMDLTMSQFKLLLLVAGNDGSRVGDLAQALNVTPPTVTASLDRLVGHGLVRREDDPIDRRLVIARLTASGLHLLQRLNLLHRNEVAECLQSMSDQELHSLFVGMEALHREWNAKQRTYGHAHGHENGDRGPL